MASTITELARLQRDFDSRHGTRDHSWAQAIDEQHLPVLLELTVALAGEVGEFSNVVKKVARGDFSLEAGRPEMAMELADILIYLLKLTDQLGVDLEGAFRAKLEQNEQRFERFALGPQQ